MPLTSFLISLTICSSAHQASLQIAILNLFPLKFLVAHSTRFNQQHSVSEIKQRFIFVRFFGERAKEKKMVSGLYANIPFKNNPTQKKINPIQIKKNPPELKLTHPAQIKLTIKLWFWQNMHKMTNYQNQICIQLTFGCTAGT
jgi:hypothetical protein